MSSMGQKILTEIVDDHIFVITLDREEARNAFNGEMARQMEAAIDEYEANDQLWAAIIQANGPTFSAGQDLKSARSGDLGVTEKRGAFGMMRQPPNKPLIAAVDGQAFAGGMEMILSCDLIVATETSQFALTETARALMAGGGGCFRLPRRIPYHIAMEMILTGEPKPAADMQALGLLNSVVPAGEAFEGALALARRITANSPVAVSSSRIVAARSHAEQWTDQQSWKQQQPYFQRILESEDMQEGLAAFAEKRAPNWKGR